MVPSIAITWNMKVKEIKKLSFREYLYMIITYLSDMINDHKTQSELKIQSSTEINFSSKDSDEICTIHTKSDNKDVLMSNKTNDVIEELFQSLLQKYQEGLEESMKGSNFFW